ncbi:U2 snRNP-associated SURP motif-containing -like isoform X1 [Chlorella sorokiniana]|uniref:U2 snRNP-associated SURP motif-containing-like isoform X1 n=1 Tax=Chlorella sorokiniana TaxID=3076 RepID=A0A2P6TSI3_CHLSO|nr:U2 snRNP-associated SURP motif-containing -like isoform X1 [Chlorella sorokiniana]|eukprot:PRW57019.1 U2 snRNP-associated SURP motif-containing -like isoform X1 [Chlorella sorokiniana]
MSFSFQVKAKKTPFQRQKELEEEKKRRDDAEAAKVYEEFVKEFAGDDDAPAPPLGGRGGRGGGPPAAFVRGGTQRPGQPALAPSPGGPPGKAKSGPYIPSFMPPGMAAAMEGGGAAGGSSAAAAAAAPAPSKPEEPVFKLPGSGAGRGKPRAIDALLANLKREQEEREARKEAGLPPPPEEMPPMRGSHDSGDPFSTNLFIGNLAPDVDEQILMREFGRFGPIGSVKVMWPRDEEQRRRGRNTGFVSFMKRDDAEKAMEALDGVEIHEMAISIGWGKSVPLPSVPCWPPPGGLAAAREGGAAVPPPVADAAGRRIGKFGGGRTGARKEEVRGVGPDIDVQIPTDPRQRFVIDAMAFYVMRDGCEFEQVVMEKEESNPEFNFLFDTRCPEHAYYRWRIFSLAAGDTLRSWRVDMFQMVEKSNRWIPPPMTVGVVPARERNQTAAQRGGAVGRGDHGDMPLSDLQRDKFEDMLRGLTVERADICAAMAFALDNAESASEVCEILGDALTLSETPIPLKIARLFLASDILHNTSSGVRNATRYRSRLEELLPDVFESLQEAYRTAEGRMAQELLRRHVLKLLRIWRGWFIFSDDYLNGLQATFLRSGGDASAPANSVLEAELEGLGDEELELRCRRAGVSRKGGRSAQISRLLALDAYLHGDSSKGGEGGSEAPAKVATKPTSAWAEVGAEAAGAQGPKSKWELQDDEQPEAAGATAVAPAAAAAQQPPAVTPRSKWDAADADAGAQQQQQAAAAAAQQPQEQPGSRWTAAGAAAESDSDDDLAATVAAAKRQAAAAAVAATTLTAAAAAQRGAAAAAPLAAQAEAPSPLPAGSLDPALEEERRQRLRQVEVVLVQFRERLEDKGLSKDLVERKVAEQRAKLLADAEAGLAAKAAAAAAAPSRAGSAGGGGSSSRGGDRDKRDKEKERSSREPSSRSERRRSRSRDRDRDGERRRSRSRSKGRSRRRHSRSRSPRRSRRSSHSRSRSRERRR